MISWITLGYFIFYIERQDSGIEKYVFIFKTLQICWDNSSLFHKKTDRGREFLTNLKLQASLTFEVMMTGSQPLKGVFARNERVPPYVEKYSMVIAINLLLSVASIKKIVKNDKFRKLQYS